MEGTEETVAERTLSADAHSVAPGGQMPRAMAVRGEMIGRYVVLEKLGAGGMGVVYGAYDPELDRRVALKLLLPRDRGTVGTSERQRLLREAQAMAQLSHPNVVAVHDVGEHQGQVFLAIEFILGRTMADWMPPDGEAVRPWRECLLVFAAAGAGLAAAHRAGLIHRDFKPDNVMIGEDGRVRVMDFGLARVGEEERGREEAERPRDHEPVESALDTHLTRTGAMMGTPAYMAPEQFAGGKVTAHCDQFAFSVALYEALYGGRPFPGDSFSALAFNVSQGNRRDPPSGTDVPGWLRDIVFRGLAPEPEQRFPSLQALLDAIERGRSRPKRTKLFVGVGTVAILAGSGAAYLRFDERQRVATCESRGAAIAAVWDDGARERLKGELSSINAASASSSAVKIIPLLDDFAADWRRAATDNCLDMTVREVWPQSTAEASNWCLSDRLTRFELLIEELLSADADSVYSLVSAAGNLRKPGACRDAAYLATFPLPPAEQTKPIEIVRRSIAQASAAEIAGRYEDAHDLAQAALSEAQALGWPPLIASAGLRVGATHDRLGRLSQAEQSLEDAYFAAFESGAYETAADAASRLVFNVGESQARHDEGRRWVRHQRLALAALPLEENDLRYASVASAEGAIEKARGQFAAAASHLERAVTLREAGLGAGHPRVASDLSNLGSVLAELGDYAAAQSSHERALEILETTMGADHPDVAMVLTNLGAVHQRQGQNEASVRAFSRALEIRERVRGPEHPYVADSLNNLANARYLDGDYEKAKALHERALRIRETVLGKEHPNVASSLSNLAFIHRAEGEFERARALHEQALEIYLRVVSSDHPIIAVTKNNLADVEVDLGDYAPARRGYEQALAIYAGLDGPESPNVSYPLTGLAKTALAEGNPTEARELARRAVEIRARAGTPFELAESRFVLARALWELPRDAGQDRAQAIELAAASEETLGGLGKTGERLHREIVRWRADHGHTP